MVCRVYSAVTTGLGRRTRKRVSDAEFWVPDCASSTNLRQERTLRAVGALLDFGQPQMDGLHVGDLHLGGSLQRPD